MNFTTMEPDNQTVMHNQAEMKFLVVLYEKVVPVLFGLLTLLAVCGNCLVIYVIFSRQKMRTVTNLLLLNLAFADLAFALVIPPFTAYAFAHVDWKLGNLGCKLMHYLTNVTAYVTVYTLVLISLIRYLTIVHNLGTARFRTKKNIVIIIMAIWVVILAANIPVVLSYGVVQFECIPYNKSGEQAIFGSFFAFAYVLPLIFIAVLSFFILHHLKKNRPSTMRKAKSHNKKKRAGRLIILVVVIFAILWLPVQIHLLLAAFATLPDTVWYRTLNLLFYVMAYFNSCANPIIYNQASKEFRDAFRETVCCLRRPKRRAEHCENPSTGRSLIRLQSNANGNTPETDMTCEVATCTKPEEV